MHNIMDINKDNRESLCELRGINTTNFAGTITLAHNTE